MQTVTLEEAQNYLAEIVDQLAPGEEVVITRDDKPVARLIRTEERTSWPCKAGSARDAIAWIAPDFDAPLEEFKEHV